MMDNFFFKILRKAFFNSDKPANRSTNRRTNETELSQTRNPPELKASSIGTHENQSADDGLQSVNDRLQSIMSQINISILNKVHDSQSLAYEYDKSGIENTECCICLEENIKLSPLLCKHQICPNCINRLIQYEWTKC